MSVFIFIFIERKKDIKVIFTRSSAITTRVLTVLNEIDNDERGNMIERDRLHGSVCFYKASTLLLTLAHNGNKILEKEAKLIIYKSKVNLF